jgi:microcystin-dependent protein
LPGNWHVCDGSSYTAPNATTYTLPDLRDKFTIGVSATKAVTTTGGAASATQNTDSQGAHNHTGNTGGYALTIGDIPPHSHPVSDPGHLHGNVAVFPGGGGTGLATGSGQAVTSGNTANAFTGITTSNTGGGGAHLHSISTDGAHLHSVTVATVPPYYAVYKIKRLY